MTSEEFERWFTTGLYKQLRCIAWHHYQLLPDHARRSTGFDDVFGDALVGLFDAIISNFKKADPESFDRFCTSVMRKKCLSVRAKWRTRKRSAKAVTSIDELQESCGDAWVPPIMMSVDSDEYPADEEAWKQEQIKEHGRVPLDPNIRCWHCGDPASRLANGQRRAEGTVLRCCYDPRCKQVTEAARKLTEYHRDPERSKAKLRERYRARRAKQVELQRQEQAAG